MKKEIRVEVGSNEFVILETEGLSGRIDVDDLLTIHDDNIVGELMTISVLLNKVGLLKSEAEQIAKRSKFQKEIYVSNFKKRLRSEASANANHFKIDGERIKLSEKSLEEMLLLDKDYQKKMNMQIDSEKVLADLDVFYWSLSEKSKKVDTLSKKIVPEEFEASLVRGVVNTVNIKK